MRTSTIAVVIAALSISALAPAAEPVFRATDKKGWFAFDTGVVRGKLRADGKSQGMPTFVDAKTGKELAHGGGNPGLLSYYRLLSREKRWGDPKKHDTCRGWPQEASRLQDGSVRIVWPPADDHPVKMIATYRWSSPTTIDLVTELTPQIDFPESEVFLSNYFHSDFQSYIYVKPPRHGRGEPHFLHPVGSDLVVGTYLAFPRDLRGVRMFYDGRWEQGHNPVQWTAPRYYAAPLSLMRDEATGITFVLMARPEECFSVEMPYNLTPPDGVAGHHSIYYSLFGQDLAAGETAQARMRLIVDRKISNERALELYQAFLRETQ